MACVYDFAHLQSNSPRSCSRLSVDIKASFMISSLLIELMSSWFSSESASVVDRGKGLRESHCSSLVCGTSMDAVWES